MDLFYKPPQQRHTECKALEENYMNCLFQKVLNDKVFVNRCVLDSILWFHVECPKAAGKFDDPVEFKRKFRDFFALNKSIVEASRYRSAEQKRIEEAYGYQVSYPEDLKVNKRVKKFASEFQEFSPDRVEVDEDEGQDLEENIIADQSEETPRKELLYGKKIPHLQANPITLLESKEGFESIFKKEE